MPNSIEVINLNNTSDNTYCNIYNEKKIIDEIINKDITPFYISNADYYVII